MVDKSFSKLQFKPEATKKLGLPDIPYPIPIKQFPALIGLGGNIPRELLIYWMMDYLSLNDEDREFYEIQLFKCAIKFARLLGKSEYWFRSTRYIKPDAEKHEKLYAKWSVYLGKVDLKRPVVTIQNCNYPDVIYSSFSRFKDTKDLNVSCYTVPSLDTVEFMRGYGKTYLTADRPFNSFDQLTHSTKKMGTVWSSDTGVDYPVNWEYGVGWKSPKIFDDAYGFSRQLNPIPADWVRYFIRIVERVERNEILRKLIAQP